MSLTLFKNAILAEQNQRAWILVSNGKILEVGSSTEPSNHIKTERTVNLHGSFLYPGFIDTHIHLHMLGKSNCELDLKNSISREDLLQKFRNYCVTNKSNAIKGFGWNENIWLDKKIPTNTDLDNIEAHRPALLVKSDGHGGIANSALLNLVKEKFHHENGLLVEKDLEIVSNFLPQETLSELNEHFIAAQKICLANGITGIHESAASRQVLESFYDVEKNKLLKLHTNIAVYGEEPSFVKEQKNSSLISIYGVKLFLDGSLSSKTAFMLTPYSTDPMAPSPRTQNFGKKLFSDEALFENVEKIVISGLSPILHAIGSAAVEQAITVYEKISQEHTQLPTQKLRIEHAEIMEPREIKRAQKIPQLILGVQPIHIKTDMMWLQNNIGEAAKYAGAWKSLLDSRIHLCGGSDSPMDEISPLHGIHAAVNRNYHHPEQAISRKQAISLYTEMAARAANQEKFLGKIANGYWANFTLLDKNLYTCKDDEILKTSVIGAITRGECSFCM